MQYGGFGAPAVFFCDLKLGKSHQISICLTYVNTASIKWDNQAHLFTKKLRIVVKYISLSYSARGKKILKLDDR